jgi:uncharacterized membrane protein
MKTAKTSNNLSTLGAFIAALPVIGWAISPILILVGFILAIVSMSKNEQGGGRALFNAIIAGPVAIAMAFIGAAVIANIGA